MFFGEGVVCSLTLNLDLAFYGARSRFRSAKLLQPITVFVFKEIFGRRHVGNSTPMWPILQCSKDNFQVAQVK